MAGRSGPKRSGTTSSGLPTKIARSRTPGKRAMCLIISALWSAVRSASCWPPSGIGSQPTQSVILPGLVAHHQVVLALGDGVVEDHEVGEQDLVHAADGLEAVQVVLGGLRLDVG